MNKYLLDRTSQTGFNTFSSYKKKNRHYVSTMLIIRDRSQQCSEQLLSIIFDELTKPIKKINSQ
jgi:hypothetical protein